MRVNNTSGVSLIELIIAAFIVTSVVVTLSLAFPIATRNIIQNKQRLVATHLASGEISALRSQRYDLAETTDSTSVGVFNTQCDCRVADFSVMPSTVSRVSGTTFTMASCIHMVRREAGDTWSSHCSTDPDTGYKNIIVRVSWNTGGQNYSLMQESVLTSY